MVETSEVPVADRVKGWRKGQILLVVFLVAAAFFAGAGVKSIRYQPIASGSEAQGVVVEHVEGNPLTRADVTEVNPSFSRDEAHMPYRSGGRIRYGFTIRNEGRWPITVTDVPLSDVLFAIGDGLRMEAKNDLFGSHPTVDFRPFRLPSGSQRYVEVNYRLNDCALPPDKPGGHGGFGWSTNTVKYEVFGISRRADLEAAQRIRFTYNSKGFQIGCERTNGSR